MAKNFSPRAHKLLAVFAQDEAKKSGSDQLLPEHFILALLKSTDGLGYLLLQQLRINVLTLQLAVEQSLIQKTNTVQFSDVPVSRRRRTILDAASVESRTVRKDYIGTEHLVVAAVREEYSVTARFFSKADISIDDIYAALAAVYDKFQSSYDVSRMKAAAGALFPALEAAGKTDRSRNERTVGHSILAEFSRDLTALARSRSLDPVIGRETEIKRMVQILSRRTKNNPVLIGDPGVGKTALVEGLAQHIADGHVLCNFCKKRIDVNFVIQFGKIGHIPRGSETGHDCRGIEHGFRDLQRIVREHILFRLVYVAGKAVRERQHQAHADDADAARDAGDRRAPLFGEQVAPRKQKRRPERHAGLVFLLFALFAAFICGRRRSGIFGSRFPFRFRIFSALRKRRRIADDQAVFEFHDARGVHFGEFGVVRDHDDQPLARDLFDQIHDLNARFRIQCARRLVGKQYFGVVDECARDGHALHLPARKLVGLFVQFSAQTYALQCLRGALSALLRRYARKREREFHVAEHRLVGYEVVTLEHEADAVVAVGVPIPVFIIFGGNALDDEIAARVLVKPADDVEKGGFAAPRMSEYRHEFLFAELQRYPFECVHGSVCYFVIFCDAL